MKKKCIMSTIMACLVLGAPAMAAPLQQPQPGDLKVNINYGLQQKEGNHAANLHFAGGDVRMCFRRNGAYSIKIIMYAAIRAIA